MARKMKTLQFLYKIKSWFKTNMRGLFFTLHLIYKLISTEENTIQFNFTALNGERKTKIIKKNEQKIKN